MKNRNYFNRKRDLPFQNRMTVGLLVIGAIFMTTGVTILIISFETSPSGKIREEMDKQPLRRYHNLHLGSVIFSIGFFCVLIAFVAHQNNRNLKRQIEVHELEERMEKRAACLPRLPDVFLEYLSQEDIAKELCKRICAYYERRAEGSQPTSEDLVDMIKKKKKRSQRHQRQSAFTPIIQSFRKLRTPSSSSVPKKRNRSSRIKKTIDC